MIDPFQHIEFESAQQRLQAYLNSKLLNEKMNEQLCKRAQRLADKWWSELKYPVVIPRADLQITGCELGFKLGQIYVARWHPQFVRDQFELKKVVPDHIALGYVNRNQLYIAEVEGVPHLCARSTPFDVERWSVSNVMTPPLNTPLFFALERAKALGYLDHLKGIK